MPQMIEFFSGSATVSNYFKSQGWETLSIDNNKRLKPDLLIDVLEITPNMLPGQVDFFWFSVPCTTFSRNAPNHHFKKEVVKYRNFKYTPITPAAQLSINLIDKCIEILSWYSAPLFIFENPVGRFHQLNQIRNLGHYRYYVNYLNFGFDYSKETYLFSNFLLPFDTKKTVYPGRGVCSLNTPYQRAKVPAELIKTIYNSTLNHIVTL